MAKLELMNLVREEGTSFLDYLKRLHQDSNLGLSS